MTTPGGMHSYYAHAYYKNPRKEGKFESENRCSCPEAQLYAGECKKVVCNKMNGCNLRVTKIAVGVPSLCVELTHTALQVKYKCRQCGHEVHKTYELIEQFEGFGDTFNEWGRYTNLCKSEETTKLRKTNFNEIEDEFRGMCQCYMEVFHDSQMWTKKLLKRIS
ncbi:hypothetical protein niasHS_009364 [Heterodera schachtii]|uniref:Uncharacterized protein n=1 Tax=Heterodera schachtii TaxID=97005 RepID=A0ABD2JBT2_HETSC